MQTCKILLVDDTGEHRESFRQVLDALDVEIVLVMGGREAIAAVADGNVALAMINLNMSGTDGVGGYEVASMLRQDERAAGLPVLYFSVVDEDATVRQMAYRMGAAAVMLNARAEPELLRHKVRTFLDLQRASLEKQQRAERLDEDLRLAREELVRQKREVEVVRRQATSDLLTGLPNRLLFEDRLSGALIRARRAQTRVGLAYLDLDRFKPINDTHGPGVGDEVLATVAWRLVSAVRASDTVARIGGDEFAIVLENLDSVASADYVGRKILAALETPIEVRPESGGVIKVKVGASVGMTLCPEHADNRNDLLMLADMAMYAVKRDGGGLRITSARPPSRKVVHADEFRQHQPR